MTTRSTNSARAARCFMALAVLLAACGGSEESDGADTTAGAASGQEDTSDNDGSTDSTVAEESDGENGSVPRDTSATITLGGDTYRFALVDDTGTCDADMFDGLLLNAVLDRVDDSGQAVTIDDPDLPEGTEHVQIVVGTEEGVGQKIISGYFGGAQWEAGEDGNEESSIDSTTKEGSHAEGTATFLNLDSGEVIEGSFEVTCAGE